MWMCEQPSWVFILRNMTMARVSPGTRGLPRRIRTAQLMMRELCQLRRAGECGRRRLPAGDDLRHLVEVARADLALVARRAIALRLSGELGLLQVGIGGHSAIPVAGRQREHAMVERMEASQRDELELVAHRSKLALEGRDGGLVQLLLPVERWRAVIRQQLAWELRVNGAGEAARLLDVRL